MLSRTGASGAFRVEIYCLVKFLLRLFRHMVLPMNQAADSLC